MLGRDRETQRAMQILCRRRKSNVCLVGEPGVGKTCIVDGLAQKIAAGLTHRPIITPTNNTTLVTWVGGNLHPHPCMPVRTHNHVHTQAQTQSTQSTEHTTHTTHTNHAQGTQSTTHTHNVPLWRTHAQRARTYLVCSLQGDVPKSMKEKQILSLDVGRLVAGLSVYYNSICLQFWMVVSV